MTSHPRRGSGPVRQHSLQQLPRRHHHHHHHHHHHQMRRQRSAEEDRSLQIRTTDPIRARRDGDRSTAIERPKVRIAWDDEASRLSVNEEPESQVEVVACQIGTGKSRSLPNPRQPRILARNGVTDKTCSTLLYSRQELAERLRLAWKQREANKSNIDVFLAQGTTEHERSDSRLSNASSVDPSTASLSNVPDDNFPKTDETRNGRNDKNEEESRCDIKKYLDSNEPRYTTNSNDTNFCRIVNAAGSSTSTCEGAKSKRANFKSCTNVAFLQPVNDLTGGCSSSTETSSTLRKDIPQRIVNSTLEQNKYRRTNSAPPQRRANSVGPTSRTQVSIVIDAPSLCKPDNETINTNAFTEPNCSSRISGIGGRNVKSSSAKRRARSSKRRANSVAGKEQDGGRANVGNNESKNTEVVTMVSLISDADSDSENEENSPRDDTLISQLRSNLPTTPIIKSNASSCGTLNSIARRPIKSVSFQQDSIDFEELDKRRLRIRPKSVQVGRVTGSALPTPEEARTWRTEVTPLTITSNANAVRQHNETQEITEICLTDREKRCLIVPIGDPRSDKKRKLLRTRSTPPPRVNGVEKQPTMQQPESREVPLRARISGNIENISSVQQQTSSILLQASISKLAENAMVRTEIEQDIEDETVEPPAFQTTKEKECWHLYRRMCDKGVCVSFDTVLRGMLTPTEYRLRRKEMT